MDENFVILFITVIIFIWTAIVPVLWTYNSWSSLYYIDTYLNIDATVCGYKIRMKINSSESENQNVHIPLTTTTIIYMQHQTLIYICHGLATKEAII